MGREFFVPTETQIGVKLLKPLLHSYKRCYESIRMVWSAPLSAVDELFFKIMSSSRIKFTMRLF